MEEGTAQKSLSGEGGEADGGFEDSLDPGVKPIGVYTSESRCTEPGVTAACRTQLAHFVHTPGSIWAVWGFGLRVGNNQRERNPMNYSEIV